MSNAHVLQRFDDWLQDDSPVAALVMCQRLAPVEGKDAVIFPPTYLLPENKAGYNIDRFSDGSSVCQIDSVGSQANRMEPIFKQPKYKHLVPQYEIEATVDQEKRIIHLLDAGHRAADAIVRFSTLGPILFEAFRAFEKDGNAEPLARIAPTSFVFGAWDSRATKAKLPRIVRSVVRAFNVKEFRRSAQYSTIAGEILEEGDAEVTTKGPKAELGLAHVPAVLTHGGVQVLGEIRRDACLNLSPIRTLHASEQERTPVLRRYILGLALVSFTAPLDWFLREGCQLTVDPDRPAQWQLVKYDGTREDFSISHPEALEFATAAAEAFGIEQPKESAKFDAKLARKVLTLVHTLDEKERKKLFRQGPITWENIEKFDKKRSKKKEKVQTQPEAES